MGALFAWVLVFSGIVGVGTPSGLSQTAVHNQGTRDLAIASAASERVTFSRQSTHSRQSESVQTTVVEATAVYRFWSDAYQSHFYTRSVDERNHVILAYPDSVWRYEGAVFGAFGSEAPGTIPVHRFWSGSYNAHFYTSSEAEKDHVIAAYPDEVWRYESIAYYAYPSNYEGESTRVMSRFWSPTYLNHFYSASEAETEHVKSAYPASIWTFEGDLFRVPAQYSPAVPLPEMDLESALREALNGLGGQYSVTVLPPPGSGEIVNTGGDRMQEPVSVIKLFVAYAVLDRIDRGLIDFTTATRSGVSVQDCLRVMIHVSDNYCHWDLVALVGNQNLNDQFWAEGYRGTVYEGYSGGGIYYPAKLSTTNDLALLLSRLHRGELLSPELTDHFMTLLETQLWRSKLPAGVPAGVPVANKTGSAWTAQGWYHSDAGIISAPEGDYVVAVLGSQGATASGVRAIGRTVYEYLYGAIGTAASYSDLNTVTTSATTYYRYASTSTPLGTIPSGLRIETYASARTWYQARYNGSLVYVHSSNLRNYYDYPRS